MQEAYNTSDEAQGHFLALAELLRDMGMQDLFGRLAELYIEFRQSDGFRETL